MENNNKKPSLIFREEIKWVAFIILLVASGLFNYFTTIKQVDMTAYRVTKIEQARANAWEDYEEEHCEQTKLLQAIQNDIIKIKVKFDIE